MIPLFTVEQIRNADIYAIEQLQIHGIVLMENAAISIVNSINRNYNLIKGISNIGIIAGKGNNGGDAFAVARHLINSGCNVTVLFVGTKNELKGDALSNFNSLNNLCKVTNNGNLIIYKTKNDLNKIKLSDIIIDGLLGTGTKGNIREPYKSIIEFVNKLNCYKVAIDLPSGLNLDTSSGTSIFNSDLTVTLANYKSGLFYGKGYEYSGLVEKGAIGIGDEYFENLNVSQYLIEPEDALIGLPVKKKSSHKYSSGKVIAIAGSGKYPGAASLLTKALFNIGTGSVILAFPKSIRNLVSDIIGEAVFAPYLDDNKEFLTRENVEELESIVTWSDVIAIGSGLGREEGTIKAVAEILRKYKTKNIVIDADAIFAIGEIGYENFDLKNKILTPHHGEFSHLIGISISELQSNIQSFGKEFAIKTKSYLVLKGAPTIIFLPNGDTIINSAGNAGMAKFGTGDVLTGVISGLLSQTGNIEKSIISGVYIHSLAADLLLNTVTEFGITATKIEENLPNAISFLRNSII